jgi:hypothetical protein
MWATSYVVAARVCRLPGIVGAAVEEVNSSDPHTIPQHLPPFNSLGPWPRAAGRRFSRERSDLWNANLIVRNPVQPN